MQFEAGSSESSPGERRSPRGVVAFRLPIRHANQSLYSKLHQYHKLKLGCDLDQFGDTKGSTDAFPSENIPPEKVDPFFAQPCACAAADTGGLNS